MAEQIILYDLPSKGRCASWSPNPWKTRISLNFKGLPYKTEWVEYPDIGPKFKGKVTPNEVPPAWAEYTIPVTRFDEHTIIMDSKNIADELEKRHPSPSLHLNSPYVAKIEEVLAQVIGPIVAVLLPATPRNLLNKPSFDYFHETREKRFGMPLDELERENGGEQAWEGTKTGFEQVSELLKENQGPFFMGENPCYADFIFVSVLKWFQRIDQSIFEHAVSHDEAFRTLYEACQEWMKKDD